VGKNNVKAANAIVRRALEKSGAKEHSRGWNMKPAVKRLENNNAKGKKK
jgi:hypothetical protein